MNVKKVKPIITDDMEHCFLCGTTQMLEMHHIMNGANRKWSTKFGLIVPLCHWCHNEPPFGVHHYQQADNDLKALAQQRFQEEFPDLDWMRIFGKNYL